MNVYDFDDTIYNGDSSKDFILFEMKRHLGSFAKRCLPMCISTILYVLHIHTKETWKSSMFSFLKDISDISEEIELFWDEHEKKIKSWYLKQQRQDDVVISASPAFLVKEACQRLGVRYVIATEMDKTSGKISGKNCKGQEKEKRFRQCYGENVVIGGFYSDDVSDQYMACIAEEAYMVKGNNIEKWK